MQGHVQRLDDHRQILSVRNGMVVDVVVSLVGNTLGTIQRRVDPMQSHAVSRQNSGAQFDRSREISTSGLTNCLQTNKQTAVTTLFV